MFTQQPLYICFLLSRTALSDEHDILQLKKDTP
jgi:hypothetical protein